LLPKLTLVVPRKPEPEISTLLLPPSGPAVGPTAETDGELAALTVKWSADEVVEVPAAVVTVTSTVAAVCAGLMAVICVLLLTTTTLAGRLPKLAVLLLSKPVPVMVTTVPPEPEPEEGDTALTVGAAALL
jgi:hypothetical protein